MMTKIPLHVGDDDMKFGIYDRNLSDLASLRELIREVRPMVLEE